MSENIQQTLNKLMNAMDLSDCTEEEKEMYKQEIEGYLNHRKRRIELKKQNMEQERMVVLNFIFEKFISAGCWEEIKEYNSVTYDDVKKDIEEQLGKCSFSLTDIDSVITNVKPFFDDNEYRIICIGEKPREVIY